MITKDGRRVTWRVLDVTLAPRDADKCTTYVGESLTEARAAFAALIVAGKRAILQNNEFSDRFMHTVCDVPDAERMQGR